MFQAEPLKELGKYQIIEGLGKGGFATVFKAIDPSLDREVALKVLDNPMLTRDVNFIARFKQEAKMMARLFHPNIATIFEVGETSDRHYIAMQYVEGQNLRDLVRAQGRLPFDQVVSLVIQIGAALDYAHLHHAVHRDVKPSNIIVDLSGQAILTDFGIAKALEGTTFITESGAVLGTPLYASPEQVESKPVDGRSDLYSLGIAAYEAITGDVPFAADNTPSLYYKIVHEPPRLPSLANPHVEAPIEAVLLKAIAKQPADRYQSGKEFAAALDSAVKEVRLGQMRMLCEQAGDLLARDDFDAAEDKLRQALALDSRHQTALELLAQVSSRRELARRYHELAATVANAQSQAAELRRAAPELADPAGVFRLLSNQAATAPLDTSPPPQRTPASLAEGLHRGQLILLAAGLLLLVAGLIITRQDTAIMILSPAEQPKLDRLANGNLLVGAGVGVALGVLALIGLARWRRGAQS